MNVEILNFTGSLDFQGKRFLISEITAVEQVNEIPSFQLSAFPEEEADATTRSAEMPVDRLVALVAAYQEYIQSTVRVEPDCTVTLKVGETSLTSRAFMSACSLSLRKGSFSFVFNLWHPVAVLHMWNGGIYGEIVRKYLHDDPEYPTGSIGQRLASIIDEVARSANGGSQFATLNLNPKTREVYSAIHADNERIRPAVTAILRNLPDRSTWAELEALPSPAWARAVRSSLINTLTSSSSLFSALVNDLRENFGVQLVSDITNGSAYLQTIELASADAVEKKLGNIKTSFSVGARGDLPVRGVLVRTQYGGDYLTDDLDFDPIIPDVVAAYPAEPLVGGRPIFINPPPWMDLTRTSVPDFRKLPTLKNPPDEDTTVRAAAAKSEVLALLQSWAKRHYLYLALLPSRTSIEVAVDLSLRTGQVYTVTDVTTGEALFSGFLSSVRHTVTAGPRGSSSAGTYLDFTHIRAIGFELD